MTVRGGAGQDTTTFMRSPGHHVHRSSMKREIKDFSPGTTANRGRCVLMLLTPDEHFSIVGGGGQNRAEFRVRLDGLQLSIKSLIHSERLERGSSSSASSITYPCNTPHCSFMARSIILGQNHRLYFCALGCLLKLLTPSESRLVGAFHPQPRKSLSSCPRSMSPICGHSSPDPRRATAQPGQQMKVLIEVTVIR